MNMNPKASPSLSLNKPRATSDCIKKSLGSRLPGEPGLWLFITADTFAFMLFFLVFSMGRCAQPEIYENSRQVLNANVGLLNTLILLTSSWFVVLAVHAAHDLERKYVRRFLVCAMVAGTFFGVLKIGSYVIEIRHGYVITTNEFFAYYYAFTFVHFMHFAVGMVVLLLTFKKAGAERIDHTFNHWIESVASYWHMVDLLWIVLFPMLYLLEA